MMKRSALGCLCIGLALLVMACAACKPRSAQSQKSPEDMNMKPFEEPHYRAGVPLTPAHDLLMALEQARKDRKLVKLPVVVERTSMGRGGWEAAYIGIDSYVPLGERILLRLHDSALGVSLADRIHQYCPEGKPCKLWLIGYWDEGPLGFPTKEAGPPHGLGLRFVLGPVEDAAAPLAYIAR
jgi:hypothetical protein